MNSRLWVLGASDPEMTAIEKLLRDAGERVAYAATCPGERPVRVHPGNAYAATCYYFPDTPSVSHHGPAWNDVAYVVECAPEGYTLGADPDQWGGAIAVFPGEDYLHPIRVIDHHRPGDPGYGCPPEEFLSASSIGQVLLRLVCTMWPRPGEWNEATDVNVGSDSFFRSRWGSGEYQPWRIGGGSEYSREVPTDIVFTAAADHCLEAAYRGRFPGVDPDALMRWRVESRAAFQGRTAEAVMADVEAARKRLRGADATPCVGVHEGDGGCADLRGETIPELPEAACREGIPYLATVKDRDGREKVVLGAAPPELVTRFLAGDVVPGLTGRYGDPARGFAGGYVA